MAETKITDLLSVVPLHRTPPGEYVSGFAGIDAAQEKADSSGEYKGFQIDDQATFGEILKSEGGGSEINEFRRKISAALGTTDIEEKRAKLKGIESEISQRLAILADEINIAQALGDPIPKGFDTLYGDLHFLREKFLLNNMPESSTGSEEKSVEPLSGEEKNRLAIKRWIENLFRERKIPERREDEKFQEFLGRIHGSILEIALSTLWNGVYDQSGDPFTNDYRNLPTKGPLKSADLLGHPQVYDQSTQNRVKDLGSFCDQFWAYFSKEEEQTAAAEFSERLKETLREVSVWHNRAVVINSHVDPKGPDGSLAAYEEIKNKGLDPKLEPFFNREKMTTEEEKKFSLAVEFCMGVWSAMALKKRRLSAVLPLLSNDVRWFVDDEFRVGIPRYIPDPEDPSRMIPNSAFPTKEIDKYRAIPDYNANKDKSLLLITDMVGRARSFGLTQKQAEMAYHIGESFRLGSGIHYLYDLSYKDYDDASDPTKPPKKVRAAKVTAQEGTPKALSIGYYVEGVPTTEARPSFNRIYAETMVHGYAPWGILTQYSHKLPVDIAGYGDNRATLLELLSIKNGVESIDWSSRSKDPDKAVFDGATQAIKFLWPRASIKGSAENYFFMNPKDIPLSTTQALDREDEVNKLQIHFGAMGQGFKTATEVVRAFNPVRLKWEDYETLGFDSDSDAISGERKERITTLLKDARDYWINAFIADKERYPADFMRTIEFMFSRDDRPFVTKKMGAYIEDAKRKSRNSPDNKARSDAFDALKYRLTGYMTYDVLMQSLFYLLTPDFGTIDRSRHGLETPQKIQKLYDSLGFANWESFAVKTIGGYRLPQIAAVMHLINQCIELRDLLPDERKKLHGSGYRLDHDNPLPDGVELPFTRQDLLRLAQKHHMAEGYEYRKRKNPSGKEFLQLVRTGNQATIQYLVDRLVLLHFLFRKNELGLSSKK